MPGDAPCGTIQNICLWLPYVVPTREVAPVGREPKQVVREKRQRTPVRGAGAVHVGDRRAVALGGVGRAGVRVVRHAGPAPLVAIGRCSTVNT